MSGTAAWSRPVAAAVVGGLALSAVAAGAGVTRGAVTPALTWRAAAPVPPGPVTVEPPALVVPDRSGIPGVVAYDTQGWPNGVHVGDRNPAPGTPDARSLPHRHVAGPVVYSVTPPVGGDHNGRWLNCGVYGAPVPPERAVHDLEHGVVWITYRPDLDRVAKNRLIDLVRAEHSVVVTRATGPDDLRLRYLDLSPFPDLPAPIVVSSWAHQLRLTSPDDPRLHRFVDAFRMSRSTSPEYGITCDDQPEAIGGRPALP